MEALSFWLISIVQDEARLTRPNYQTHHPVLRVKKVEFLEELSLWGGQAIKSFTASDAVIEELISFRLTHQILQIPAGTLSFWRLFFFKARRCKVIRSVFLMLIFCHETIQSIIIIILSVILHLFISSFL